MFDQKAYTKAYQPVKYARNKEFRKKNGLITCVIYPHHDLWHRYKMAVEKYRMQTGRKISLDARIVELIEDYVDKMRV